MYEAVLVEAIGKYNEITKQLLENFLKTKKGENIAFSPMSVIMLLGIAANSVDGKTRDEIVSILCEDSSYESCMAVLKTIQEKFIASGSLMSSNAVCVRKEIYASITEGYEDRLRESFEGRIFSSDNIVKDVNVWVKEKTKGMIQKAADDSVNQMSVCLINAMAFEAEWLEEYEKDDIHKGNFNNANGTISEVQMMESFEDTYIEDDFFTGFVKPYKDKHYAFMALLPKKKKSASFMLRAVNQTDFSKLMEKAASRKVSVTMPEFKYDFAEDLTEFCKKLGVKTLFTPEADFSPMAKAWLEVDSIIHKAHIEVDRKGTKAAAVTMANVFLGCAPNIDVKTVCLDRPFVYAIMNTETGLSVFAGVYNQADK